MKASLPRGRGTGRWRKLDFDTIRAGELLRDYAIGCEGDPLTAVVFRDQLGRHRRIVATYAGGWRLQVNFSLTGDVSSCQLGCTLRITASSKEVA
jgi:hypothetical protein